MPVGDGDCTILFYSKADGVCTYETIGHIPEAIIEVPVGQDLSHPFEYSVTFTATFGMARTRKLFRQLGFRGAEILFPKKHRKARRARRREKVRRARNANR